MQKKRIAIFILLILVFFYIFPLIQSYGMTGSIRYEVHLRDIGWKNAIYDGNIAGTTGQARRMEAIAIALSGVDGKLTYQVHVQDYGWLTKVSEGNIAGTTGQARRMEAIIINLDNSSYNIKYRVHVQDYGWMNWVSSGQIAGTTGQARRIEAIQIKVEKKQINNNENNNSTTKLLGIDVSKHQGVINWVKVKESGKVHFAIIRSAYRGYTEGGIYEDTQFINNVKNDREKIENIYKVVKAINLT